MSKTRLEAFSDAVIAIILTIMVLELKVLADAIYVTVALIWLVPDKRIEKKLAHE